MTNIEYNQGFSEEVTHVYIVPNANRDVSDLEITSSPVVELIYLSWTNPPELGSLKLEAFESGSWSFVQNLASSSSAVVPMRANGLETASRLRVINTYSGTDYASNEAFLVSYSRPQDITGFNANERYDGVEFIWDDVARPDQKLVIKRSGVIIYNGEALTNYLDAGVTGGHTYEIGFYKGSYTSGDMDYGGDYVFNENIVVTGVLSPAVPPAYTEPADVAADLFVGMNRDVPVLHIAKKNWYAEARLLGSAPPNAGETYFHSSIDYVFVTSVCTISSYTLINGRRRFYFSNADVDPAQFLDDYCFFMVSKKSNGTVEMIKPSLEEYIEVNATGTRLSYMLLGGTSVGTGVYPTGASTRVDMPPDVAEVKFYITNIKVNGRDLQYEAANLNVAGDIMISPTEFRVNNVDFGSAMFLGMLEGNSVNGGYITGLLNRFDDVFAIDGSVDTIQAYYGPGSQCLQVIGSAGGTGWGIEMEHGKIWREVSGQQSNWWNAGVGRVRTIFAEASGGDPYYKTDEHWFYVKAGIEPDPETRPIEVASGTDYGPVLNTELQIDDDSLYGIMVTPITGYEDSGENTAITGYNSNRTFIHWTDTSTGLVIFKTSKEIRSGYTTLPSGDPWYDVDYTLSATTSLVNTGAGTLQLVTTWNIEARNGSVGQEQSIRIPEFSYSFIRIK